MRTWLTTEQACAYLKVGRRTLYRYVQQGKIPAYKLGEGGALRFKQADLDAFLQPVETTRGRQGKNP